MKLGTYLKTVDKSLDEFAAEVGVSPVTVWRWCAGQRRPGPEHVTRIKALTGGRVTADDFYVLDDQPDPLGVRAEIVAA